MSGNAWGLVWVLCGLPFAVGYTAYEWRRGNALLGLVAGVCLGLMFGPASLLLLGLTDSADNNAPPTPLPPGTPLPWARAFGRRCTARTSGTGTYRGRCELRPHDEATDHALERGLDTPRWSTRWTA